MRTPRRLVAAVAATALGWSTLGLVVTPAAYADNGSSHSAGDVDRDPPHDPATYYAGTEGLSGSALALKLNEIIDGNTQLTYAQVYDALPFTDEDPSNTANLIVFYSGTSLLKTSRCGGGSCAGQWNREHTWPQSHGDLGTGVGPGTDMFHMRPEFADTNSSRGNKDFNDGGTSNVPSCAPCKSTSTTFEPRAAVKGDLARGLMYMDVRFNGDASDGSYTQDLVLGENIPTSGPHIGKLSTLVLWSLADPPDDRERARNDMIDGTYQHNRNPFIDHPEWVCSIWGSSVPAGTCNVAANQPPTTAPMTKTIAEDSGPTTVALTGNDPDGDTLTWSITTPAGHGTASITGGSTLNYTPAADFNGQDVVGVTVSDGKGGTAATTVTITVTSVNDVPVATPQSVTTAAGTAKVIALAGTDVENQALTFAKAGDPAHGTVSVTPAGEATYTPEAGYTGPDSFTFTVSDGTDTSAPATVSVNVSVSNNPPSANASSFTTPEDTAKLVFLAGTDIDGDTLSYAKGSDPAHGTVAITTDGQATYTPAANYHGPDSFTFTVNDGSVTSAPATVGITVTSVNDVPTATAATATTDEDTAKVINLAGTDADGDTLTFTKAADPADGTVSITSGGVATYTPAADYAGPDSFTFTVSDGTVTSAPAQISVTVNPVNDAPTGTPVAVSTQEDNAKVVNLSGTDVEGDAVTFAKAGDPAHGTVTITPAGVATYSPAANYHGPDSFTFTANDGTASSAPATVTVTVSPVNDEPVASPATLSTTFGSPATVTLPVSDPDGDTVSIIAITTAAHGTTSFSGTQVTYTPTSAGPDALFVTVSDGKGGLDVAPLDVQVGKAPAGLAISAGTLKQGASGKIKVKIKAVGGVQPTGKVTLKIGTTKYTVTLKKGVAKFKIPALPDAATVKVKASYAGDSRYAAGKSKRTFTLQ